jgi:hypothetical protein
MRPDTLRRQKPSSDTTCGWKGIISRLAEGAIDGATLRGVDFRVASGLLLARIQTARKYVADMAFQFYWSSAADWQWILLRWSVSVILLESIAIPL